MNFLFSYKETYKFNIFSILGLRISIEKKNKNYEIKVINITNKKIYNKKIAIYFDSGIGDYMFLIPFLPYIRNYYKNDKITFIGSIRFKDIVLFFDKEYIDEYIYFYGNDYHYEQLKDFFKNANYDLLISHYYLRMTQLDKIIETIDAKEKIGNYGGLLNLTKRQRVSNTNIYTKIIYPDENDKFEIDRNKDFFTELLNGCNISIKNLEINLDKNYFNNINFNFAEKYAIIFPSATDINRQWKADNFKKVCDHLYYKYNIISYIVGSKNDVELADTIKRNSEYIKNICGKYKLHELFFIFNKAKIVVTNDSAGYHIAMSTSKNIIVISSGGSYIRFTNYPEKYKKDKIVSTPIPEDANNKIDMEYFYDNEFLNTITYEQICNLIDNKYKIYLTD